MVQVEDFTKLHQLLEEAGEKTRKLLSNLPETELDSVREAREQTIPVRWVLTHVIDHTALHLGHMQITYQLWQGGRGVEAPRWFERLPK